jgi:hypothetical protein
MAKDIYICEECAFYLQSDAPTYTLRCGVSSVYNYQTEHKLFFVIYRGNKMRYHFKMAAVNGSGMDTSVTVIAVSVFVSTR